MAVTVKYVLLHNFVPSRVVHQHIVPTIVTDQAAHVPAETLEQGFVRSIRRYWFMEPR